MYNQGMPVSSACVVLLLFGHVLNVTAVAHYLETDITCCVERDIAISTTATFCCTGTTSLQVHRAALHGDSEGWKAISRPLGHNTAQARAVRNG